ncbi:MAG: CPBP family glutamic-type intramembrane protease [Meiothermus sp.]|uniref:CPBP family glutamic-type intramembrane protease n=1 Tax=Meiothermus sp. TaxID=1955249 RepID=UPI00298EDC2E|nr:CPBP family glutamic-type intramembrane protease [Meiothermus sp.]MCX7782320.1 CPBP family glutamic-type intramembrane protease [Meiothermus sp.]MDW8482298.1 CPBP family glutamic-type intramembrane protease [Meiothermus sp.]
MLEDKLLFRTRQGLVETNLQGFNQDFLFFATATILLAPLLEEALFRGLALRAYRRLLPGLGSRLRFWLWGTLSTVAFSLVHGESFTHLAPHALIFGYILWRIAVSRGFWNAVVAHSAYNLTAILLALVFSSAA